MVKISLSPFFNKYRRFQLSVKKLSLILVSADSWNFEQRHDTWQLNCNMLILFILFHAYDFCPFLLQQVCRYRGRRHRRRWFVSPTSQAWLPQGNLYRLCLWRLVSTWVIHGYWGKVLDVQWIELDFCLSFISTSLFPTSENWPAPYVSW